MNDATYAQGNNDMLPLQPPTRQRGLSVDLKQFIDLVGKADNQPAASAVPGWQLLEHDDLPHG